MKSRPTVKHAPRQEDGGAMIAALWLSLILALLAIGLISMSRNAVLETKTKTKLEAVWLKAESGISIAKYNIAKRQNRWAPREAPYTARIAEDDDLTVYITSPRGKLDINYASPALLSQIFTLLGYESERAVQMADRLADWRDEDSLTRLYGAERADYQLEGGKQGPANAPFRDVKSIGLVLGMTPQDVNCLTPFLTIYAQSPQIEPASVRGALRPLLGLPEQPDNPVSGFRRSSLAGQVFEVTADVAYSERAKARVIEVFRYTGIPSDPVWTHHQTRTIVAAEDTPLQTIPGECPSQLQKQRK